MTYLNNGSKLLGKKQNHDVSELCLYLILYRAIHMKDERILVIMMIIIGSLILMDNSQSTKLQISHHTIVTNTI